MNKNEIKNVSYSINLKKRKWTMKQCDRKGKQKASGAE